MNIVLLGAGYAGLNAALRLARRIGRRRLGQADPARHSVTLVGSSDTFVERVRLHETAAGRAPSRHRIGDMLANAGVRFVVGQACAVDRAARTVTLADGERLPWDRLVLALGSRADVRTPGAAEHAVVLDGDGPRSLAHRLPALARTRGTVLVVGGGLTGIEAATEIAEAWPSVRVVLLARGAIGAGFSPASRAHIAAALARLGVATITDAAITRVEHDRVLAADGTHVPFDACVWTVGFVGAPVPQGLDLPRNARDQLLLDPFLRSIGDERIHVAGDLGVLAVPPPIEVPMGCKSAAPAGAHVADNLVAELSGEPLAPFDYVAPGYCVSLGRGDALVQFASRDGSLGAGRVWRGKLAVLTKAFICAATVWTFRWERLGLVSYAQFRRGNVAPRALAAAPKSHEPALLGASCNPARVDPTTAA